MTHEVDGGAQAQVEIKANNDGSLFMLMLSVGGLLLMTGIAMIMEELASPEATKSGEGGTVIRGNFSAFR